jgi:streptogramin lyase
VLGDAQQACDITQEVLVALAASLFALRLRSTAANHATKVFPLPRAQAGPSGPVVGPDGNIWFLEIERPSPHIARITPDGYLTEFSLPTNTPNVAGNASLHHQRIRWQPLAHHRGGSVSRW